MKKFKWSLKQVATSQSMGALYLLLAGLGLLLSAAEHSFKPLVAAAVVALVITAIWTVLFALSGHKQDLNSVE
jgi:hypothetical protein